MVFSTIIFLLRFLPITLALYYLAPPKLKNTVLFLCSLVFYCWGEVRFFPVMLALILINYLCGLGLERFEQNKTARLILLLIALAGSLGMLFYFKYANFVLSSINAIFGTGFAPIQGISVLPLGISFYTFQTLSYTIDVYRRDVETEHNIIDFGAYVVMFPQLIAGPIVKYRDVSDRLHVYKGRYELKQIEDGMTLFTFGLAKKVLLADAIGALWTDIIGVADSPSVSFVGLANASTPLVWLGVIAYSLQLYLTFHIKFLNSTNWKLSLCQSILLAPDTELIQHSHQRFSSFRKRIFHLRRNLRILGADDQFVCFQLLEIHAEGLVGNGFQIPFQLIEPHGFKLHQTIENDHLVLA